MCEICKDRYYIKRGNKMVPCECLKERKLQERLTDLYMYVDDFTQTQREKFKFVFDRKYGFVLGQQIDLFRQFVKTDLMTHPSHAQNTLTLPALVDKYIQDPIEHGRLLNTNAFVIIEISRRVGDFPDLYKDVLNLWLDTRLGYRKPLFFVFHESDETEVLRILGASLWSEIKRLGNLFDPNVKG